MGSKKRAAWSKAKSEFLSTATGGDMSDLFAREDERRDALVMAGCESRGRRGLACYKCEYCGGWHLTSHPWK